MVPYGEKAPMNRRAEPDSEPKRGDLRAAGTKAA
jgi:hypothetical protein